MSLSSKSPRKVILVTLAVGQRALPAYAHRFSPKVFTQPQLFACRAFMALLRTKGGRRKSGYTQRWQVETVMSMIKRNLGEELAHHSRNRQMRLLVVVHNCMILLLVREVCDRACQVPLNAQVSPCHRNDRNCR